MSDAGPRGPATDGFVDVGAAVAVKPGTMLCVEAAGRRVLVANVDGHFYATDETCTHEDASLCLGALHGALVTCPLHGSRFDLRDGRPLEEPAEDPLRCYRVRVENGRILVGDLSR